MTPDEFREVGKRLVDWVADYMQRLDMFPVQSRVEPGEIAAMLPDAAPEAPEPWDAIIADLDRVVVPGLTHWQAPGFFGYFPANSTPAAILGDLVSSGLGVQGMLWSTSPACTEIETKVLDWLADLIGLPEPFTSRAGVGGGVIQGTASESVLVALLAARELATNPSEVARLSEPCTDRPTTTPITIHQHNPAIDPKPLIAYCSNQAHSSVDKAAMIAGVGRDNVRLIDTDPSHAMRPDYLARAIEADLTAGCIPFFVCATLGTTSSGAFDPLDKIAEVLRKLGGPRPWLHVDAAWAGAACVCPEHRAMLRGVEHADSFNFNPHKWLLTTFDCSAMWVRDRAPLIAALSITPEYLRNAASDTGAVIDYRDWQIPLGRRFRALKLWFVLRSLGAEGLREHIRRSISLAEHFESLILADDRFELATPRSLSLVCFRLRAGDTATERLLEQVNATGEAFFTHTRLPDPDRPGETRFVIRAAIGGVWTRAEHVRQVWSLLQSTAHADHA